MKLLTRYMDNVLAMRLGEAGRLFRIQVTTIKGGGDHIDHGLLLRRLLEEAGFGIVQLTDKED